MIKVIIFIIGYVFFFWLYSVMHNSNQRVIRERVKKINGKIISIELYFSAIGSPFYYQNDGEFIYKFTYKVNEVNKVGWVRTGLSNTWVMDYKQD